MFCIKCGKQIVDSSLFCKYCGAKQPESSDVKKNEEENLTNNETKDEVLGSSQGSSSSPDSGSSQGSEASQEIASSQKTDSAQGMDSSQGAGSFQQPDSFQQSAPQDQNELSHDNQNNAQAQPLDTSNGDSNKRPRRAIVLAVLISAIVVASILVGVLIWRNQHAKQDYDSAIGQIQELEDRLDKLANSDGSSSKADTSSQSSTSNQTVSNNQPKSPVTLFVRQVENTSFPQIHFYASVLDGNNKSIDNLKKDDFKIQELQADGSIQDVQIDEVYQVIDSKMAYIDLVIDRSGSMSDSMMRQAKNAASSLIRNMKAGNQVEVLSFDNFVYQDYPFSADLNSALSAIASIQPYGATALMDALYTAVYNTYKVGEGAKCVIAFTDGIENVSNYTVNDVVNISQSTGIPVYLIGVGSGVDERSLRDIAQRCSGEYFSASDTNLEQELSKIYNNIYIDQQNNYIIKYTSKNASDTTRPRQIVVNMSDNSGYTGSFQKEFVPVAHTAIDTNFGFNLDQIIPDSSRRELTNADLNGLSLAQLRIARNEIFARHGRLFKDNLLNQWFYSKSWYLQIQPKYSPSDFDSLSPYPISALESNNLDLIMAREDYIINYEKIFPNAGTAPLSTYDVALTREVLEKALSQVSSYPQTSVRDQNIAFIQNAINNATM